MGLKALESQHRQYQPRFGVVFEIGEVVDPGGPDTDLVLKGRSRVPTPDFIDENVPMKITFTRQYTQKQAKDLVANCGPEMGSIILVSGVARAGNEGEYNATWANIIKSKKMARDPKSPHHNRAVFPVMATVPTMLLRNVDKQTGEPNMISWPINADERTFGYRSNAINVDRSWLSGKVAAASRAGQRPMVYFDILKPEDAILVKSQAQAMDVLKGLISEGHGAVIRFFDADGEVRINGVSNNEHHDFNQSISKILRNGFMRGLPNESVFNMIAAGELSMEIIKSSRVFYAAKGRDSIVAGFLDANMRSGQMIDCYGVNQPDRQVAQVIYTCQIMGEMPNGNVTGIPITRLVRGGNFSGNMRDLVTPHFDRQAIFRNKNNAANDRNDAGNTQNNSSNIQQNSSQQPAQPRQQSVNQTTAAAPAQSNLNDQVQDAQPQVESAAQAQQTTVEPNVAEAKALDDQPAEQDEPVQAVGHPDQAMGTTEFTQTADEDLDESDIADELTGFMDGPEYEADDPGYGPDDVSQDFSMPPP